MTQKHTDYDDMHLGLLYLFLFTFFILLFEVIFFLIEVEPLNKSLLQNVFTNLSLNPTGNQTVNSNDVVSTANYIEQTLDDQINFYSVYAVCILLFFILLFAVLSYFHIRHKKVLPIIFLLFVSIFIIVIFELLIFYHMHLSSTPYIGPSEEEYKYRIAKLAIS